MSRIMKYKEKKFAFKVRTNQLFCQMTKVE